MEYNKRGNKRGYTTLTLIGVMFIGITLMLILGVLVYALNIADDTFSQINFNLGVNDLGRNISFGETYNETLKPGIVAASTTVPKVISTGILLGMILCMILVAYATEAHSRLWIMLDLGIIIVAEMAAVLVKSSFVSFINSSPAFLNIFSTTLSVGSKYILNLPIIVPSLGAIIIIVTYISVKKEEGGGPFG